MPKLEVFVSHRTVEAKFADLLCKHLAHDFIGILNFFVSTDITSVPAGSQWFHELLAGLQRAHVLFVVCSDESVRLPWISYESGGARARGVDVIPLCHSGMTPDRLPAQWEMLEGVTLSETKGLEKLYAKISSLIGCDVPAVDFQALGREFTALEREYAEQLRLEALASRRPNSDTIVQDPRVMCVSSRQYRELGLANELQTVLDAFPKDLRHDVITTSRELHDLLAVHPVDVVHIAGFVCPRSGTLYFSRIELPLGRPADLEDEDYVRADALALLLQEARTRLVVIASGDSLALATRLLPLTNVISPNDRITARAMAKWVSTFYASVRNKTIAESCELATAQSGASMRLLTKQVPSPIKLVFGASEGPGAGN
jgi:hypothetical protein